ncbi:uncharacterized protein CLUP02_18289 [Colletotrichum lupini]|uniref:Uncharacterized protein n=2 Tax=Colletotrichum acutatum species complex TaxID=2707335 RepID=A0A9Q8SG63_9PEZI|nr:uncharacterized protein CLUP02_18289 [Colletotrichum lupini]XP_060376574.1 uncharacterized protein CTAM01_12838 [Colletotrichum tamarilloi]KAK1484749.1 hypothetical protein CTAM01_12838 [Colletotrichum tamarilloi]KAK1707818.1 hypothetical protein BDP67DRAFT_581480 [Colletotrichum lupini]UQC76774.1 hypothetical protein CLUP02_18289 [Colletotrichum lupini]
MSRSPPSGTPQPPACKPQNPTELPPPYEGPYKHAGHLSEFPLHLALLVTVGVNKARNCGSQSPGRGDDKPQSGAMSTPPRIAVPRLWPAFQARVSQADRPDEEEQPPP